MHKLPQAPQPECFASEYIRFVAEYPPAIPGHTESKRWEAFKNECQQAYEESVTKLLTNQHGLCAFCEISLSKTNRQIEHFIPKSLSTQQADWTCNFFNYTLSCKGNTNAHAECYSENPDAQSNYTCGHKKDNVDPRGKILSPYELPEFPIFTLELVAEGIYLRVDKEACARACISPCLAQSTLEFLNLNCPNLTRRRYQVWKNLVEEIEEELSDQAILSDAQKQEKLYAVACWHLQAREGLLLPFYTVRLLCLSDDMPELLACPLAPCL